MFRERRRIKRKIERNRKLPQESTTSFLEGTFLLAGGIAAAIYFCIDFYQGDMDFISAGGLFLSIISGVTGYHLIEKANRGK